MSKIVDIRALEILDSRGVPTIQCAVFLDSSEVGTACVPSGASTGQHEALELRDGDNKRYFGKGVTRAISYIHGDILKKIRNQSVLDLSTIDQMMCALDGSELKTRLGANSILAVSMACMRAHALAYKKPLYAAIRSFYNLSLCSFEQNVDKPALSLPIPLMNVINGGAHADNPLDIQEFMIVPHGFSSFSDALRAGTEIFHALKKRLKDKKMSVSVGDEGGFAPAIQSAHEALSLLVDAILAAGYKPQTQVSLALDVAASEFYDKRLSVYHLKKQGVYKTAEELVKDYTQLLDLFPIISIEDGMAEDDMAGWQLLTKTLSHRTQLVGDDLFVTQQKRLQEGAKQHLANAILIKLNQVGSVKETLDTMAYAQLCSYASIVSHRSGETEDTFIADLAVATGASQIKTGGLSRSERLAKYNRLLNIESELGASAIYQGVQKKWPNRN